MGSVSDTRYKQRAVIEFLVAEKESVENIHKQLCAVYGSCAVNRSTVGHWVQRVKASRSGEMELHDRPRSGRPATATSPDILVDVIARGETINLDAYIKTLQKLKQRYRRVRPKQESRRHVASARQRPPLHKSSNPGGNRQIWLDCAPPSSYSHDLVPSDFHLFGPLKDTLRGTSFEDEERDSYSEDMDT
jgi:hypothetical protein